MPLILPGNVGSATAATGFDVANSCRFNNASDDSLTRSLGASETSLKKGTFSYWIKRAEAVGTAMWIYSNEVDNDNNRAYIEIDANDNLRVLNSQGGTDPLYFITDAEYRDFSAWSHFVIAIDTTQGTESNRVKIYNNGVQITSFSQATYPSVNTDLKLFEGGQTNKNHIGNIHGQSAKLSAYLSEFVYIDGTQNAATDFGEFDDDSGIWKPIDVSGLTFGTNGFYLDFEDSAALGDDVSGNGNDFTVNNLTAIDQSTDTCTNNFAVMNPLNEINISGHNFTEGNTVVNVASGERASSFATIGMTNGKWYCEMKLTNASGHDFLGIAGKGNGGATDQLGWNDYQWSYYSATGKYAHDAGEISFAGGDNTWGVNDIIGLAIDLDSGTKTLKWHKNGTYQSDVTLDENASDTDWGAWFFACGSGTGANDSAYAMNFGNPSFAISSGNADGNGYGNFEYAVPSGYYALCTKNLAEYG